MTEQTEGGGARVHTVHTRAHMAPPLCTQECTHTYAHSHAHRCAPHHCCTRVHRHACSGPVAAAVTSRAEESSCFFPRTHSHTKENRKGLGAGTGRGSGLRTGSRLQPGGPQAAGLGGTQEQTDRQTAAEWEVERPPGRLGLGAGPHRRPLPLPGETPRRGSAHPSHRGGQGKLAWEPGPSDVTCPQPWCFGPRGSGRGEASAEDARGLGGALSVTRWLVQCWASPWHLAWPLAVSGGHPLGGPAHALQDTHKGAISSPACEPWLPPWDWACLMAGNLWGPCPQAWPGAGYRRCW